MDHEFWHEAWKHGRTGFHQGRSHVFLERHHSFLGTPGRVLVPLAGKSHDLLFLAGQGHHVVGVELSEVAVRDFFAEHALVPDERTSGPFKVLSAGRTAAGGDTTAGSVSMWIGDFFAFEGDDAGPFTALYDRAAIVALPEAMRAQYAAHVRRLMPEGASGLIVTFDYPQELMEGPPFAVSPAEVRRHYQGLALEEVDSAMADSPKVRASLVPAIERCYTLRF